MAPTQWPVGSRWRGLSRVWPWLGLVLLLLLVRISKGAVFADAYALVTRLFWPGPAQSQWIQQGAGVEAQAKLELLEADNRRLRGLLGLQQADQRERMVSAAVISRTPRGWWQQLELGKGSFQGIASGDAVLGPGGLVGRCRVSPGDKPGEVVDGSRNRNRRLSPAPKPWIARWSWHQPSSTAIHREGSEGATR